MNSVSEKIKALEEELSQCRNGYISRKVINGKVRFYLQWMEDGKLKSKYIKDEELDSVRALVEHRKELQEQIKELKSTPEGISDANQKRKAVRNMQTITGTLMSEDRPIAKIKNGIIVDTEESLLPLYLKNSVLTWNPNTMRFATISFRPFSSVRPKVFARSAVVSRKVLPLILL